MHLFVADVEGKRVIPAFLAGEDTLNTMYAEKLPALSQFTICFWFQGDFSKGVETEQFIVSLAVDGEIM